MAHRLTPLAAHGGLDHDTTPPTGDRQLWGLWAGERKSEKSTRPAHLQRGRELDGLEVFLERELAQLERDDLRVRLERSAHRCRAVARRAIDDEGGRDHTRGVRTVVREDDASVAHESTKRSEARVRGRDASRSRARERGVEIDLATPPRVHIDKYMYNNIDAVYCIFITQLTFMLTRLALMSIVVNYSQSTSKSY